MPCCETCSCAGEDFDCLAVVAPERYRHFAEWCKGDNPSQRMLVRDMSRMGIAAIDAMNPKTPPPPAMTDASATQDGPKPIAAPPSLIQKAANFGKAIVTHAIAGFPEADEETFAARISTCRACEFSTPEPLTCLKCGCGMLIKARWADQRCPIGKW